MTNSKSTLAKLLAKENISVQYGNFRTASFDVDARVLRLPLWKYENKGLLDMLVGHEVGHALYTPVEGWHDCDIEVPGIPRAFVNVIEDIRIEKLIMRQYPGLVRSFKQGYTYLYENDFFEIKDEDISTRPFMDRLNIKSKLRDLIEVPFNPIEQTFVDLAMSVETWDDVIDVCRKLLDFAEEQSNDLQSTEVGQGDSSKSEDPNGESKNTQSSPQNDGQDSDDKDQSPERSNDTSESEANSQESGSDDSDSSEQDEASSDKLRSGGKGSRDTASDSSPFDVKTDDALRRNEDKLLDVDENGKQKRVLNAIKKMQAKDIYTGYDDVLKSRQESREAFSQWFDNEDKEDVNIAYSKFIDETKRTVGLMAKEFEMRKAAYQYQRAKTARSGTLDTTKLHSYRYNDDIFSRITTLADAKSHGMVMTIDYSGSMCDVIDSVIKQVLNLVMFCKKVNIPFDVYGFTNRRGNKRESYTNFTVGDIDHGDVQLTHLLSSQMTKSEYETAYRQMFCQTYYGYGHSPYTSLSERMGGTPLNEILMMMPDIIRKFKSRTGVQKVTNVLLTDGDAQRIHYVSDHSGDSLPTSNGIAIDMGNKIITCDYYGDLTTKLLENIAEIPGVTNVGYFLADGNYSFNGAVGKATGSWNHDVFRDARKMAQKQKFISYDNVLGYNRFFIMKADRRALNTDTEEFKVSENAKKNSTIKWKENYIMMNMTVAQENIVKNVFATNPDKVEYSPSQLMDVAQSLGYSKSEGYKLAQAMPKVRRGIYNLEAVILPLRENGQLKEQPSVTTVSSVMNDEVFVPQADPTYIKWGNYKDIESIVKSGVFYPVYISGLSGNGKTMMVEQACAKTNRQYVRIQITPETDEDDLIGGFRLINGETVFSEGPVIKAMKQGAILLIDEIDRGSNKIMALQGVLEGKPVLIKKTGEVVKPSKGFNVIATANTKGKGSDDGRFIAATIIDEAFLERFTITIEQPYPSQSTERRILIKHMEKFESLDESFAELLSIWSETIRKTYDDGGVDELISTRRLCHIVQTYAIFNDRMKAIQLCINRFDDDTKEAFLDLYSKVDSSIGEDSTSTNAESESYEHNLNNILEDALNESN